MSYVDDDDVGHAATYVIVGVGDAGGAGGCVGVLDGGSGTPVPGVGVREGSPGSGVGEFVGKEYVGMRLTTGVAEGSRIGVGVRDGPGDGSGWGGKITFTNTASQLEKDWIGVWLNCPNFTPITGMVTGTTRTIGVGERYARGVSVGLGGGPSVGPTGEPLGPLPLMKKVMW